MERIAGLSRWRKVGHLMQWSLNVGTAILDQGLFSGSNFLLSILLARWLSPDDYGAFSLAFAMYLFFTGIHNALILEPMTVLGPANHARHMPQYIMTQIKLHFLVTGSLGLLLVGFGVGLLRFGALSSALAISIVSVGCGLPFMLLPWLVRRLCYLLQQPARALASSFIYGVIFVSGMALIGRSGEMENLSLWFGLISVAGLCSISVALRLLLENQSRVMSFAWNNLIREHWEFGRWVVVATILNSIATQAQLFLTAGMLDLDSAGAWRALQNFTLPVMQGIAALSVLGMPILAKEFGTANFVALRRKGAYIVGLMTLVALFNEAILLLFGHTLGAWVYGGKYERYFWLLPFMGVVPILTAPATGYSLMLRAIQRPSYYLVVNLIGAVVSVTSGMWMTRWWGIAGATWSIILVSITLLVVNLILFRTWFVEAERKNIFKSRCEEVC